MGEVSYSFFFPSLKGSHRPHWGRMEARFPKMLVGRGELAPGLIASPMTTSSGNDGHRQIDRMHVQQESTVTRPPLVTATNHALSSRDQRYHV